MRIRFPLVSCLMVSALALAGVLVSQAASATALDDYVARPDDVYQHQLYHTDNTFSTPPTS